MLEARDRELLLRQHEQLRRLLRVAVREAERLRAAETGAEEAFVLAIHAVRELLTTHNQTEEAVLKPHLGAQAHAGFLREQRMLEEHTAEHGLFEQLLDRTLTVVAERMQDLGDELEAHMLAEERTFLSPVVFRAAPPTP